MLFNYKHMLCLKFNFLKINMALPLTYDICLIKTIQNVNLSFANFAYFKTKLNTFE